MKAPVLLSVVIPCHGGVADTRACLASLADQRGLAATVRLEVVIVDNGSPSPSEFAGLEAQWPAVRTLRLPSNRGFAAGVNAGVEAARGDTLLLLNNDTMAAPHLLARLLAAAAAVGPSALIAPVSNRVKGLAWVAVGDAGSTAEGRAQLEAMLAGDRPGRRQDADTLAGLCLLLDRAEWGRLGGFDERFGLGNYEDDDLCLRAQIAGRRLVIARDAFLHHQGSRTFHALGIDYARQLQRNRQVFDSKWQHDPAHGALRAVERGDLTAAADLARRARRVHPAWAPAELILGNAALRAGDGAAAARHLETFLGRCPEHTAGRCLRVAALLQQGATCAATVAVHELLDRCHVDPDQVGRLLVLVAEAHHRDGRQDAARELLAGALELMPDDTRARQLAATLQPPPMRTAAR